MFRLTREVRFAWADQPIDPAAPVTNSFAGFPSLNGITPYLALEVTLAGAVDPRTAYLINIKRIDQAVRKLLIDGAIRTANPAGWFDALRQSFEGLQLQRIGLRLSPFLVLSQLAEESGMHTRLSQRFEFSASHRLHNPLFSDAENQRVYGKCNHHSGHGHNYQLEVTLRGTPTDTGVLIDVPVFEAVVKEAIVDRFDHKNLNLDLPEFATVIPSVENIARVIYQLLRPSFKTRQVELASVTVWETSKTWCEYSE